MKYWQLSLTGDEVKTKHQLYFEGNVLWIHDYEIKNMKYNERFTIRHFSFTPPLSRHSGTILLTENAIVLDGDENLVVPLETIEQLYYGYDDLYTAASVKNFGVFWKPLRIRQGAKDYTYLIINYRYFNTSNEQFLTLLKDLLL